MSFRFEKTTYRDGDFADGRYTYHVYEDEEYLCTVFSTGGAWRIKGGDATGFRTRTHAAESAKSRKRPPC